MDIESQSLLNNKNTRQDNRKCYRILGAIFGFLITIGGLLASFYAHSDRILAVGASAVILGGGMMLYSLFHDRHASSAGWPLVAFLGVVFILSSISVADSKLY